MNNEIKNNSLDVLRAQAQEQYDKVVTMNFEAAMQYTKGGYNQFRLIYERDGDFGNYLYPKGKDNDRLALYNEFSHKANQLFRQKMEEHHIIVTDVSEQDRADMYLDAWNRGHASGYNEVWNYYMEVTEMYDKVRKGQMERVEFDDYLDI